MVEGTQDGRWAPAPQGSHRDVIGDLIRQLAPGGHSGGQYEPRHEPRYEPQQRPHYPVEAVNPAARAALPPVHGDIIPRGTPDPQARTAVIVDLNRRLTHVFQINRSTGRVEEVMTEPDAPGAPKSPTPPDRYTVIERRSNPSWTDPETMKTTPAGPNNPLGPRAIRLGNSRGEWTNIEMHGTNRPWTIGTDASHACIRHKNDAITRLYPLVHMGSAVYLTRRYEPSKMLKEMDFR